MMSTKKRTKLLHSFLICPAILLSFTGRTLQSCKTNNDESVRCLQINVNLPVVDRDGSLIDNNKSVKIYFQESLVMYEFPYRFDSSYNGKFVTAETRNYFFIYKKGALYGYTIDNNRPAFDKKRLSVDSLLLVAAFQNFRWHIVSSKKPVFSEIDSIGNLIEIYSGPNTYDTARKDSMIYYYSDRYREFDFSFSKILDSAKGKKLFKIRLLYPKVYSEEHKITFPKRETRFEMSEVPVENLPVILAYFERYRKHTSN